MVNRRNRNFHVTVGNLSNNHVGVNVYTMNATRSTLRATAGCIRRHDRFNDPVTDLRSMRFGLTSVLARAVATHRVLCLTTGGISGGSKRTSACYTVTGHLSASLYFSITGRTLRLRNNCNCLGRCPLRHRMQSLHIRRVLRNAGRVVQIVISHRLVRSSTLDRLHWS